MKKLDEKYQLVLLGALALAVVLYIGNIWSGLQSLTSVFFPIILGGILAFIFNVPMKKLENLLAKCKVSKSIRRALALFLEVLLFFLIMAALVSIVVPTLSTVVSQLTSSLGKVIPQILKWLESLGLLKSSQLNSISKQLQQSNILNQGLKFLGSFTGNVTSFFGNFFSIIMGIFLMFAILGSKEHLQSITYRLMKVCLPEKAVKRLAYMGSVIVETYDNFLMGQLIEAVIISLLIFAAYSLAGLPYAALTAVLAGVLSFIPYIGPFSACALGAVFIFTVSPLQALISIAVFQAVQLVEGNLIYPRVVGSSIGLPSLFTLAAALIGGNLFGLVGMIFFTPIFAVIYRLVKEFVVEKETSEQKLKEDEPPLSAEKQ